MDNNINQTIIEKVAIKSVAIYKAIVTNPAGIATSDIATLTVTE